MATSYSARYSRPLGVSNRGFGGAGLNLGIEALCGETEMVTTFDDFNGVVGVEAGDGTTNWETLGWELQEVGTTPANDTVSMNDANTVTERFDSCIKIYPGDDEDDGISMQLDRVTNTIVDSGAAGGFPHIWIPETAAGATVNDNTTFIFATRIGLRADVTTDGAGDWDGKMFIGWAEAGDAAVLVRTTGLLTVSSGAGPVVGFGVNEDGSIVLIAQRTVDTALAEGTNFTTMIAAGGVDGTVANGAVTAGDTMWFDLALRMDIVDQSSATDNGAVRGYYRRVRDISSGAPGQRDSRLAGDGPGGWVQHGTVLENACPNHDVGMVPTIEAINGPTSGQDVIMYVDWWCMGVSRYSLNQSS